MLGSPKKFVIELESRDQLYAPGGIVSGRVVLELEQPESIGGLLITVGGRAEVEWIEDVGKISMRYKSEEEYFSMTLQVLGQTEIQAGSYVYPFNFRLPLNIPSSFEYFYGHIRYTVKAVVRRPLWINYTTSVKFAVFTPYDLSECTTPMTAVDDEEYKTFCCFPCLNMGGTNVNVSLPTTGFTIGEDIVAKININNTSMSVNVTKVELEIRQIRTAHGFTPEIKTRKQFKSVGKVEKKGPFDKMDEIVIGIPVPMVHYSNMIYCTIIDIEYKLRVVISFSGCHCSMKRTYPIVIGSRATPLCYQSTVNPTAPMPTTPFFPGEEFSGNTRNECNDPAPVSSNNIPPYDFVAQNLRQEKPPSSYNEAMHVKEKH